MRIGLIIKPCLIPILIILVLTSGLLSGCRSVPISESKSTKTPTISEFQSQVKTLQEELNRLKEQKRVEILKRAEAYKAIIDFLSPQGSQTQTPQVSPTQSLQAPTGIQKATIDSYTEYITTVSKYNSELLSLIKATNDAVLISQCKPEGVLNRITPSYSYIKSYAENRYRELMDEYNNQ